VISKKVCSPKSQGEKRCEIKGAVMGKNFNNNNSGEFGAYS